MSFFMREEHLYVYGILYGERKKKKEKRKKKEKKKKNEKKEGGGKKRRIFIFTSMVQDLFDIK